MNGDPTDIGWANLPVDDADRPDNHLFSTKAKVGSTMRILEEDNHVRSHSEDNEEVAEHKLMSSTKYLSIFITVKIKNTGKYV